MKSIKRLSLILVAIFMLGGVTMANENRGEKKPLDAKAHAERMTERMVKEYGLNDTQKQQLLEINQVMAEKIGDRPMRPHHPGKKGKPANMADAKKENKGDKDANVNKEKREKKDKEIARADRDGRRNRADAPKLSTEEREKRREEMKQVRENYNTQLQKIMNADQYQAYTKKQAEFEQKRKERGEKMKENRREKKSATEKTGQQV